MSAPKSLTPTERRIAEAAFASAYAGIALNVLRDYAIIRLLFEAAP